MKLIYLTTIFLLFCLNQQSQAQGTVTVTDFYHHQTDEATKQAYNKVYYKPINGICRYFGSRDQLKRNTTTGVVSQEYIHGEWEKRMEEILSEELKNKLSCDKVTFLEPGPICRDVMEGSAKKMSTPNRNTSRKLDTEYQAMVASYMSFSNLKPTQPFSQITKKTSELFMVYKIWDGYGNDLFEGKVKVPIKFSYPNHPYGGNALAKSDFLNIYEAALTGLFGDEKNEVVTVPMAMNENYDELWENSDAYFLYQEEKFRSCDGMNKLVPMGGGESLDVFINKKIKAKDYSAKYRKVNPMFEDFSNAREMVSPFTGVNYALEPTYLKTQFYEDGKKSLSILRVKNPDINPNQYAVKMNGIEILIDRNVFENSFQIYFRGADKKRKIVAIAQEMDNSKDLKGFPYKSIIALSKDLSDEEKSLAVLTYSGLRLQIELKRKKDKADAKAAARSDSPND